MPETITDNEKEKILDDFILEERKKTRAGSGDDLFYEQQIEDYVNKQRRFWITFLDKVTNIISSKNKATIESLTSTISERDAEIKRLNRFYEGRGLLIGDLEIKIKDKDAEISNLTHQLLIEGNKNLELKSKLEEKEREIYNLMKSISAMNKRLDEQLQNSIPKSELNKGIDESRISTDIGIVISEIELRKRLKL